MLGTLEKIVWGLALFALVAVGGAVLILGGPSTTPYLDARAPEAPEKEAMDGMTPEQKVALKEQQQLAQEAKKPSNKGGAPAKAKPKVEYRKVSRGFYDRIKNETSALQEASTARSDVVDDGAGLKIYAFEPSCLLKKMGFEENDVIRAIGGRAIDWSSTIDKTELYHESRERYEQGIPSIVDFERNGRPMQFVLVPE